MYLKLTKLAKLTLRSKLTTIDMTAKEEEKTTAKTIVDNSVLRALAARLGSKESKNFDNFERSVNSRKLSSLYLQSLTLFISFGS